LSSSDLGLNYNINFVTKIIIIVRAISRRYLNSFVKSIRRAFVVSVSSLGINLIDFFLRNKVNNKLLYVSQISRYNYVIELLPLRVKRLAYKVVNNR
jgi:hypothetical protein